MKQHVLPATLQQVRTACSLLRVGVLRQRWPCLQLLPLLGRCTEEGVKRGTMILYSKFVLHKLVVFKSECLSCANQKVHFNMENFNLSNYSIRINMFQLVRRIVSLLLLYFKEITLLCPNILSDIIIISKMHTIPISCYSIRYNTKCWRITGLTRLRKVEMSERGINL